MSEETQSSEIESVEGIEESGVPAGVPQAGVGKKPPRMDGVPLERQVQTQHEPAQPAGEIDIGSPALNTAVKAIMASSGATVQDLARIADKAIDNEDMSQLDYAYLYEHYKGDAQNIIELTQAIIESRATHQAVERNRVFDMAGGESNWNVAAGMFNQNAPQYLKTTVKHLMDNGQVNEGAKVLLEFVQSAGFVPSGQEMNITGAARGAGNQGLTAAAFAEEMNKLKQEAGNRSLETGVIGDKYNALIARRRQGRAQGL